MTPSPSVRAHGLPRGGNVSGVMQTGVFQPRREQWIRQRYQLAPPESLRSRPQLEDGAPLLINYRFFKIASLPTTRCKNCLSTARDTGR